jgi:hypothetical protein
MKKTVFLILLLCLTGCSQAVPLIVSELFRPKAAKIRIASDIPASDMPCVPIQSSNQSELSIRKNIVSESANAFLAGNFEKLENYYSIYRQRTSRTTGGRWKLQFFYSGLLPTNLKTEKDWIETEAKILKWIKAYPKSPAPYIVYSGFLINRGWYFRGGGFAKDVSPEAANTFHQNIELARSTLESSKEIASVDPQWYANMVTVAKAQSWSREEVKKLLQEALSQEPYYHQTYHEAFSKILPKWSGSFEEAENFADDAVAITKKCEGRGMYARIYWRAFNSESEFTYKAFASAQVNWKKMSEGFEDILVLYPDPWNVNSYASFACLARDKVKAKELINKIGNKPVIEAWNQTRVNFTDCQKWAFEP